MANARPLSERAIPFVASDWVGGQIKVIRSGVPAPGQIGPHKLPLAGYYNSSVYALLPGNRTKEVGLTILQDRATGDILLIKAGLVPSFNGVVLLESYG